MELYLVQVATMDICVVVVSKNAKVVLFAPNKFIFIVVEQGSIFLVLKIVFITTKNVTPKLKKKLG
jgi:hypothetical protein